MTTETIAAPAAPPRASRLLVVARAARPWLLAAGSAVDKWDGWCLGALAGLLLGMTVWFGFGPALTIVSVLVLVFGVAGAKAAEETAARATESQADFARRPPRQREV